MPEPLRFLVDRTLSSGVVDTLSIEPSMVVVVEGWTRDPSSELDHLITLRIDGEPVDLLSAFRVRRDDVRAVLDSSDDFHGAVWQFRLPPAGGSEVELGLEFSGEEVLSIRVCGGGTPVPYDMMLDSPSHHQRSSIYASGPPDPAVNPEALALAGLLPPPILDFGCGSGALVRALRSTGCDARGLEVDRPEIRAHLYDEVRDHVLLTSGGFPLPLPDRSVASVVATEVLEHIEDVRTAAAELMRIADQEIFVTVPDASAIPLLFPHAVVPWHMLEASHVNFFSFAALEALFEPTFAVVQRYRIGKVVIDGTLTYTSVAARLRRA